MAYRHADRKLNLVTTTLGLVAVLAFCGFADTAYGQRGAICTICDSSQTLTTRFPAPNGYSRVTVAEGSYADWLRHLLLLPPDTDATDWRGRTVLRADEIGAVIDWRLLGRVEQCADVGIRAFAEYARHNGGADHIAFRSLSGQTIEWQKWLEGRYGVNAGRTAITYQSGNPRSDTAREFDRYLTFVMSYTNTASLMRDLEEIEPSEIQIGDVLIQPKCAAEGMGHMSLVMDACEMETGERRYLFADGFTPARLPVIRQLTPNAPQTAWMTPDEYFQLMEVFGPGTFYRPPDWVRLSM